MQIRLRDPNINSKWRTTGCEKLTFSNLTNCSDFAFGVKNTVTSVIEAKNIYLSYAKKNFKNFFLQNYGIFGKVTKIGQNFQLKHTKKESLANTVDMNVILFIIFV